MKEEIFTSNSEQKMNIRMKNRAKDAKMPIQTLHLFKIRTQNTNKRE